MRPARLPALTLALASLSSVALGALFASACSSSSSNPSSDAGAKDAPTVDAVSHGDAVATEDAGDSGLAALCATSAAAICGLVGTCEPFTGLATYGDAGCVPRQTLTCLEGQTATNTGATPAHTTACAAAETTESCADYLDLHPPAACAPVMGPGAVGSGCARAAQCASGYCSIPSASSCGTCQAPPTAGTPCADLYTCGPTLTCYGGVCAAYATTNGSACSKTQPCGRGLSCVTPEGATSGTCNLAGETVGTPCDPGQHVGPGCDPAIGLYCAGASAPNANTCQTAPLVAAGMPCGYTGGVENDCVGATCERNGPDAGSTCVARAADEAPCNTATGPACTPPARCIGTQLDGGTSGTCKLPPPSCP